MNNKRDHATGGPAVRVEPHPVKRLLTDAERKAKGLGRLGWFCGDCDGPLVYGRDGKYRHRRTP